MKKKLIFGVVAVLLVTVGFLLFGCHFAKSTQDRVQENMSEWTKTYFYGEGEGICVSLSAGLREGNYVLNGTSEKSVDFALLTIKLSETNGEKVIKADISVDGEITTGQELELHPLGHSYMVDLETSFTGNEDVEISFAGQNIKLENLSKNFQINDQKAIEIGTKQLEKQITKLKKWSNLNAECYLRVLDKKENNFDQIYWCFSVVNTDGENFSVIISTIDGSVLATSQE